jgi:hypothetical protein
VLTFAAAPSGAVRATGATGPIQLGGDDQNDHGDSDWFDHDADPATPDVVVTNDGWKYVMLSLKEMLATELRAGADNSIAVIGTDGTSAYVTGRGWTENDGGASCTTDGSTDTYCMMEVVKAELDRLNGATAAPTVTYYETAAEVTTFFNGLTAGTSNVAVIFFPGDGGSNDLGDGATANDEVDDDQTATSNMEQALMDSATDIAAFNAAGGGVLSSGSDHYLSWLTVLLPNLDVSDSGTTCTLAMTTDGADLWTGLTDTDIASCWHNHFIGDLGALKVLALGWNGWVDADSDNMIDAGEATAANWDGPDGISGNADDAQTRVVIGGAAGEAAIGEELPPTNKNGDITVLLALMVAILAAVGGAALVAADRKRLQA